jgi:hypothetical protein
MLKSFDGNFITYQNKKNEETWMVVYIFVKECEKVWHKIPSIPIFKACIDCFLKKNHIHPINGSNEKW